MTMIESRYEVARAAADEEAGTKARLHAIDGMVRRIAGSDARVLGIAPLDADRADGELKHIGYGAPIKVTYRSGSGTRQLVFRTQSPNWFGHDRRSDRACLALLAADTYADQPKHVRVLDVGAVRGDELVSVYGSGEFYLATTFVEGAMYASDLRRVEQTERASSLDLARAEALAHHLCQVHAVRPTEHAPELYRRSIRDLIGSGEGIFGIADSYPDDFERLDLVRRIEQCALDWRWSAGRGSAEHLCRTHGDFHPYNLLFRAGTDLAVLDASRGGVGDPADDLVALSINYVFAGLRRPASWPFGFRPLWRRFFESYLQSADDEKIFDRFAPYFAWRALVLASPAWYPQVSMEVRTMLLAGALELLSGARLRPASIEALFPCLDVGG